MDLRNEQQQQLHLRLEELGELEELEQSLYMVQQRNQHGQ